MKRRKTQQTIRAERIRTNKRMAEQNAWTFFDDSNVINHWGSFTGSTTFTVNSHFSVGDLITINQDSTTSCAFGLDLAYKHTNPKLVHPARRRKAMQDYKDMMNDQLVLHSGSSVLTCKKLDSYTWVVTGDVS